MQRDALCAAYGLTDVVVPVGTIAQEPVVYVGRVVADTDTGDGKLNSTSLAIEGYAADASTQSVQHTRVALDLREVPGFSLFPGQIVAVKGINALGHRMLVQALYHGAPAPQLALPTRSATAMVLAASNKTGGALSVWVAAGPFTVAANCAFDPLRDFFLEAAAADRIPDVIVLVCEAYALCMCRADSCACTHTRARRLFAMVFRLTCSVVLFWMRSTPLYALALLLRQRQTAARLRCRIMTFGMKRVRAPLHRALASLPTNNACCCSVAILCTHACVHAPPSLHCVCVCVLPCFFVCVFVCAVVYPLSVYLADPKLAHTRVIIIPSWNDAFSQPTLPQPAYSTESLSIIDNDSVRQVSAWTMPHARACTCCF